MPVSSEVSVAGPYTPNGETTAFPFAFKAASAGEVIAVDGDGATISTALYSVTLDDDEGGTLTFGTAPEVADYSAIYIISNPDLTQPSDFDNAGPSFNPAALTRAIDRAAIRDLKQQREIDRSVRLPFGEDGLSLPAAASRLNKFFSFDASGGIFMSSGTGADAGLRDDLASGGAALVGFIQSGTGAVARPLDERLRDTVSVKDFGALGDGSTNDRTAIQAAFDSGAKKVVFPRGIYKVTGGGLTVPNWLHLAGEGYGPTAVPGDSGVCVQFNLTSGIALDCGFNPTFDNIYFTNVGGTYDEGTATLSGTTASCIDLTDNLTMNYCSFAGWSDCIRFGPSTFYVKTFGVEFNRCTNGYRTNGAAPYNIDIYAPISRLTTNFFAGQSVYPARNIKVHGGSIEGYSTVAFGFLDVSFFGTYFETISQRAGAIALDPEVNGSAITLVGCLIYMDYTARFANMSARTGAMLTSVGNQYDGVAPSGAVCLYMPTSGSVNLSGDRFGTGHPNDATYVDSIPAAAQFNGITFPVLPSGNSQAAYSGMALVGARGFVGFGLTSEPSAKTTGMTVMADGDSWDPLTRAAGRPYWTIWQGDRWYGLSGDA